jgi:uncharacterized protein YecE (DUF72 family)
MSPTMAGASDLLIQYRALLDRLAVAEALSFWKQDLQAWIWRTQDTFMYINTDVEFGALKQEVEAFKRACQAFLKIATARP